MKKILILEDSKTQLDYFVSILSKNPEYILHSFINLDDAISAWNSEIYDLYILDINVQKYNSIYYIKVLLDKNPSIHNRIIFITAFEKYAVQAIHQTHCYDYLVKPVSKEKLLNTVSQCLSFVTKKYDNYDILSIRCDKIKSRIIKDEIIYIEALNKRCIIYTKSIKLTSSRLSLSSILVELNSKKNNFIRCHNSFIVNKIYVNEFNDITKKSSTLIMTNNATIPVGYKFYEDTKKLVSEV